MSVVDARGLSCPEPVLLTKRTLEKSDGAPVKVLVDEMAAAENVAALAGSMGWQVTRKETGTHMELVLKK
ncbi:MAG: SirA family protein [Firmicutes bacterium HGW-Firmicutes-14]|nr:MAG: SirA family protein [Firmicutes bacterium HGW-Firmicutes-14]